MKSMPASKRKIPATSRKESRVPSKAYERIVVTGDPRRRTHVAVETSICFRP